MLTKQQIAVQLKRLHDTGFAEKLAAHATANNLPVPFFYAIASRETNCVNMLGDHDHGVGIVQIDIQHKIALDARNSGSWKTDPDPLIEFGAKMLAANIQKATQQLPAMTADEHLKVAASGYNHGIVGCIADAKTGDSDKHTTGHDYGADVMDRMAKFAALLADEN